MVNIKKNNYAKIHASLIEESANIQINTMLESPAIKGQVAIMPDVHCGAGCVIGFTAKTTDKIIPFLIGVDIGCGVLAYPLGKIDINFKEFDIHVRKNIPLGFNKRSEAVRFEETLYDMTYSVNKTAENIGYTKDWKLQIGTLGGGNHFIEVAEDESKNKWLLIHTGSRNFGLSVATFYQKKAEELCKAMGIVTSKGLEYLPLEFGGNDYLKDMKVAQVYAKINRRIILKEIIKYFDDIEYDDEEIIESVHNYIDDENMMRKGAISAHKGEIVIIPMNMAEGSIIGEGLGNKDYNYSAPHGSGRVHGRKDMFRRLDAGEFTMKQFEDSMEGIFSTSICKKTFDESKFAYKQLKDIEKHLLETVEIIHRLKPIYNLKSD